MKHWMPIFLVAMLSLFSKESQARVLFSKTLPNGDQEVEFTGPGQYNFNRQPGQPLEIPDDSGTQPSYWNGLRTFSIPGASATALDPDLLKKFLIGNSTDDFFNKDSTSDFFGQTK